MAFHITQGAHLSQGPLQTLMHFSSCAPFLRKMQGFMGNWIHPPVLWIRARHFECPAQTLQRASLVNETPDPQSTFVVSKDFGCVSHLLPGPTESKRWAHTKAPPCFGLGSAWTKVAVNAQVKTAQPTSCYHGRARMQWLKGNRKSESLGGSPSWPFR